MRAFLFLLVMVLGFLMPAMGQTPVTNGPAWDSKAHGAWSGFDLVSIPSSKDGKEQKAYVHFSSATEPRPLVISLHTWGGNYQQVDPLADLAAAGDWNCIHPDFRGPNTNPDACLSPLVVSDIDDAVDYMVQHGKVDPKNIYLVGVSGGGYASCGMLLKSRHTFAHILAWAPITDLGAWYDQCSAKPGRQNYAKDILACVGPPGGPLDRAAADARSPMKMPFPATLAPIDLYEGINDGWKGSVPISHTLLFYNRLVDHAGASSSQVTDAELKALCDRTYVPPSDLGQIGGRKIIFHRECPGATVTIFQGGHEMLPPACFERLQALAASNH